MGHLPPNVIHALGMKEMLGPVNFFLGENLSKGHIDFWKQNILLQSLFF